MLQEIRMRSIQNINVDKNKQCFIKMHAVAPLELEVFSAGSVQVSVKPQAAATPAAVLMIHRYCGNTKYTIFQYCTPDVCDLGKTVKLTVI